MASALIENLGRALSRRELLRNLTLRELRTRYRRSILGWGWSLLNPLAITACYTLVFSVILDARPEPGHPSGNDVFALFLMAGLLPWTYFANSLTGGTAAVLGARALIEKVHFPRELLVFATVLSLLVTLLIELTVLVTILTLFGYVTLHLLPWLIITIGMQTLLTTGIALLLAASSVRSRDVPYLTGLGLTVWFFVTPIVYSIAQVPEHSTLLGRDVPLRSILKLNPMARFTDVYRSILWDVTQPGLKTLAGLAAISLAVFLIGYRFFTRRAPYFAEEL
ncbi:MAG: ABC transporter permease [Actinomycetota bacterium]|nr:ABC transporter permease [Actinomycetota bacterium]